MGPATWTYDHQEQAHQQAQAYSQAAPPQAQAQAQQQPASSSSVRLQEPQPVAGGGATFTTQATMTMHPPHQRHQPHTHHQQPTYQYAQQMPPNNTHSTQIFQHHQQQQHQQQHHPQQQQQQPAYPYLPPSYFPDQRDLMEPPRQQVLNPAPPAQLCCHQCKTKRAESMFTLCTVVGPRNKSCKKKYCGPCLKRIYHLDPAALDPRTWQCPSCECRCTCAACQRSRRSSIISTASATTAISGRSVGSSASTRLTSENPSQENSPHMLGMTSSADGRLQVHGGHMWSAVHTASPSTTTLSTPASMYRVQSFPSAGTGMYEDSPQFTPRPEHRQLYVGSPPSSGGVCLAPQSTMVRGSSAGSSGGLSGGLPQASSMGRISSASAKLESHTEASESATSTSSRSPPSAKFHPYDGSSSPATARKQRRSASLASSEVSLGSSPSSGRLPQNFAAMQMMHGELPPSALAVQQQQQQQQQQSSGRAPPPGVGSLPLSYSLSRDSSGHRAPGPSRRKHSTRAPSGSGTPCTPTTPTSIATYPTTHTYQTQVKQENMQTYQQHQQQQQRQEFHSTSMDIEHARQQLQAQLQRQQQEYQQPPPQYRHELSPVPSTAQFFYPSGGPMVPSEEVSSPMQMASTSPPISTAAFSPTKPAAGQTNMTWPMQMQQQQQQQQQQQAHAHPHQASQSYQPMSVDQQQCQSIKLERQQPHPHQQQYDQLSHMDLQPHMHPFQHQPSALPASASDLHSPVTQTAQQVLQLNQLLHAQVHQLMDRPDQLQRPSYQQYLAQEAMHHAAVDDEHLRLKRADIVALQRRLDQVQADRAALEIQKREQEIQISRFHAEQQRQREHENKMRDELQQGQLAQMRMLQESLALLQEKQLQEESYKQDQLDAAAALPKFTPMASSFESPPALASLPAAAASYRHVDGDRPHADAHQRPLDTSQGPTGDHSPLGSPPALPTAFEAAAAAPPSFAQSATMQHPQQPQQAHQHGDVSSAAASPESNSPDVLFSGHMSLLEDDPHRPPGRHSPIFGGAAFLSPLRGVTNMAPGGGVAGADADGFHLAPQPMGMFSDSISPPMALREPPHTTEEKPDFAASFLAQ